MKTLKIIIMKNLQISNQVIDISAAEGVSPSVALNDASQLCETTGIRINLDIHGFNIALPSPKSTEQIIADYKRYVQNENSANYWDQFEKQPSYTDKVCQHMHDKHGAEGDKYTNHYDEALKRAQLERDIIKQIEQSPNPFKLKRRILDIDKHRIRAFDKVQVAI